MSAERIYPRLHVTRRSISVLVTIGAGHRGYQMQRRYTVRYLRSGGESSQVFIGEDDGIVGWAQCVDYTRAVVIKARSQR